MSCFTVDNEMYSTLHADSIILVNNLYFYNMEIPAYLIMKSI